VFFDDNAVRVTTVGDASQVSVRRIVCKDSIWAELFKASLALWAIAVGVNQAANRSEVAGLELVDSRADSGYTPNDFVAGNTWIDSGHHAPLVTDLVKV
jgi:hypothetical protein